MQAGILFARSAVAIMLIAPSFAQSPEELAATGSAALKAQQYPEAEKCYRELVRIMPQSAELPSNLGLWLYRALARENIRDAEAYYGLGLIYMDVGRKAIDRLAQFKDSAFVSLVRAEFYAERPEWSAITVERYREAVSRSPEVPGLRTRL